jgi:glutaredoxin 3
MAKIEIYTTPFCGYCARAKGLLDKKGAAYEEMDVMMDEKKRTEMRERSKRSTVPQIFINGQHIGGSDELAALEQAGKLDPLLAPAGLRSEPMSSAFKAGLIQTNVSNEMAENVAFVREQAGSPATPAPISS